MEETSIEANNDIDTEDVEIEIVEPVVEDNTSNAVALYTGGEDKKQSISEKVSKALKKSKKDKPIKTKYTTIK